MLFEVEKNDIKIARIKSFDFPYHLHTHVEIMICIDGILNVTCNNQEQIMHKNDIMISFPNEIHSCKKTEFGRAITILFNPEISELFTAALNTEQYHNFTHIEDISSLADEICYHFKNKSSYYIIYGYLHIILGMVLIKSQNKKSVMPINAFDSAIRYISQNYTKPITLKEVAEKIGVSQAHLSRVFSEKLEGGYCNYLRLLRIEKAKTLLKSTDLNIYEIMYEAGFSDQRTFNRVFKNITDMTPKEYRKKSRPVK